MASTEEEEEAQRVFKMLVRRAEQISARVQRMEFVADTVSDLDEGKKTAAALLIAGLVRAYAHGMPLATVMTMTGVLWPMFETATQNVFETLIKQKLEDLPPMGGVM